MFAVPVQRNFSQQPCLRRDENARDLRRGAVSIDRETLHYLLTGDRYVSQGIDFALRITSFLGCHDALMVGCGQQLGYVDDSPQRRPDLLERAQLPAEARRALNELLAAGAARSKDRGE